MKFREWLICELFEWSIHAEVPPEPGTSNIPPNNVRLYTYTKFTGKNADQWHNAAESLHIKGLDINMAQGSNYGEPNAVWASTEEPNSGKIFAEWSIDIEDKRWLPMFKPYQPLREWEKRNYDVYFLKSIQPEEIISVHEPWHHHYRYLVKNPELIKQCKSGEFDHLTGDDKYGPAIIKVKNI